jgi:hypothetical protein
MRTLNSGFISSYRRWRSGARRKAERHLPSERRSAGPDDELNTAVDDLLDELSTITARLRAAIWREFWPYATRFPSSAYRKHKAVIGARDGSVRQLVSRVYIDAVAMNSFLSRGEVLEVGHRFEPIEAKAMLKAAEAAKRELLRIRP